MTNLSQNQRLEVLTSVENAWKRIAPTWPLQNVIACNPLQGFEDLKFEQALQKSAKFFQRQDLPEKLELINHITIKWCQVFFDKGQATITMPRRELGFYKSWKNLAAFDDDLCAGISELKQLPLDAQDSIVQSLDHLEVSENDREEFLPLLLTSLAGWSSYVKYLGEWSYEKNSAIEYDYLAIRLIITSIIWPEAAEELISWHKENIDYKNVTSAIDKIIANENEHQNFLLNEISKQEISKEKKQKPDAQIVFCIDVRSESMRRAVESCGNYETFGFAGFFGVPTTITNQITNESYASCPVLLTPKHNVIEKSGKCIKKHIKGYSTISEIKKFYQALKYNLITPLPLAEGMGIWSGGWMFTRSFLPKGRKFLQRKVAKIMHQEFISSPDIDAIPFADQCSYAQGALTAIGLVDNFADLVVFCGHGSQTENNSFASALDCGACGGRHGDSNAKILAKILNQETIRNHLRDSGINIPKTTKFIGAKQNTTTDEVEFYAEDIEIAQLRQDFEKARRINNVKRAKDMGCKEKEQNLKEFFFQRSHNWSEVQPEWGLAKNASFIVGPRSLTKNIDLEGRAFLHSYDWEIDKDNSILNLILNAPMVVAQWINSQYLFSTLNNVSFGSGSKITQNIVAKIGVMQGNASDLMHGLPMQSVYFDDQTQYHKPSRLVVVVYAPSSKIYEVINNSPKLEQLFANQWLKLYCLDPRSNKFYQLSTNNSDQEYQEKFGINKELSFVAAS